MVHVQALYKYQLPRGPRRLDVRSDSAPSPDHHAGLPLDEACLGPPVGSVHVDVRRVGVRLILQPAPAETAAGRELRGRETHLERTENEDVAGHEICAASGAQ